MTSFVGGSIFRAILVLEELFVCSVACSSSLGLRCHNTITDEKVCGEDENPERPHLEACGLRVLYKAAETIYSEAMPIFVVGEHLHIFGPKKRCEEEKNTVMDGGVVGNMIEQQGRSMVRKPFCRPFLGQRI